MPYPPDKEESSHIQCQIRRSNIFLVINKTRKNTGRCKSKLQTTQPTSGGTVKADTNCCKNCVETSRPQQWRSDLPFFRASRLCRLSGWLALLFKKAGDVKTNPGPTNTHKQVWICDICHKQIHARRQISIRCNRIEHWVHLRCAGIRQAQYTDTWTCYLHRESRRISTAGSYLTT